MNKDIQDIELIKKYVNGELDTKTMHELEKKALDDPFLLEALEGYEHFPDSTNNITELKVRLQNRLQTKTQKPTVETKKFHYWSIAASVVILIGLATMYLNQPKEINFAETDKLPTVPTPSLTQKKGADSSFISQDVPRETKLNDIISEAELAASKKRNPVKETNEDPDLLSSEIVVEPVSRTSNKKLIASSNEKKNINYNSKENSSKDLAPISLSAASPPAAATAKLSREIIIIDSTITKGIITDVNTSKPIYGAILKDIKTNIKVLTNENGEYTFPFKAGKITITAAGYESKDVDLKSFLESTNINLKPKTAETADPLTVYVGNLRKSTSAKPSEGWSAFKKYLNDNNELESGETGQVIVEFIIKPNGELADFKILKSLSKLADARAIDLIKNYHSWTGAADGYANRVKVSVRFK
ncbi:energy transducer TonB [Pseudopedobacter beijingensis]|uniref:Energy transducer TonB n=1 Tax=Pseudopedobacter beijingensis TaxID=1207056 RepID=A0ABW4IBI0_9SPHI